MHTERVVTAAACTQVSPDMCAVYTPPSRRYLTERLLNGGTPQQRGSTWPA
jgi:hypothetical protein